MRPVSRSCVRRRAVALRGLLLAFVVASAGGCARATKTTVRSGIEALTEDEQIDRLARLGRLAPDLEPAIREFIEGTLDSTLVALESPERQAQIDALVDRFVGRVERSLVSITETAGPAARTQIVATVRETLSASLDEALGPKRQQQVASLAHRATYSGVRGALSGAADGLRDDLGPAAREEAEKLIAQLSPAARRALDEELTPAIEALTEKTVRAALRGVATELDGSLGDALERTTDRVLGRVDASVSSAAAEGNGALDQLSGVLAIALAIVLAIGAVIATVMALRIRALDAKAKEREQAIGLMTKAVATASNKAGVDHVLDEIKHLGRDGDGKDGYAFLQRWFVHNPHLKVQRGSAGESGTRSRAAASSGPVAGDSGAGAGRQG